jgi:hypothetical protein
MRMILLLSFLISSQVMAFEQIHEGMERGSISINFDSLSRGDTCLPNKENWNINKFFISGSGAVSFLVIHLRNKIF